MVSVIIVAAGKGVRMNEALRKQYLSLAGRPILSHTLLVFDGYSGLNEIFLVVPEEDLDFCYRHVLWPFTLQKKIRLIPGGPERQDSVYNGLLAITNRKSIVVIHDGVRPFVRPGHITACINGARHYGACAMGIPAYDTLKHVNDLGWIAKTIKRDAIWLVQTPQAFQYERIMLAHEKARKDGFFGTDDALLVERLGEKVKMIQGSRFNIKITTREDLVLAKAILQTESIIFDS
jgi:2-C-methyl-D-erythritol 4-phosphate cytidylyltransferase